jgi:murein DD-endopeptidase MepM/ murein hydrolase activator NlpD
MLRVVWILCLAALALAPLPATTANRGPVQKAPVTKVPVKKRAVVRKTSRTMIRWRSRNPCRYFRGFGRYVSPYSFETPEAILKPDLKELPPLAPPVQALRENELTDSFRYKRCDGVVHHAIDIFRPAGTEVLASVDGVVEKLYDSVPGGITLYLRDDANRFRFYYAHLGRYAQGVAEGVRVRRGDLLGYLGKTGNAKYTSAHLHLQVMRTHESGDWWKDSGLLNPHPILLDLVRRGVEHGLRVLPPLAEAPEPARLDFAIPLAPPPDLP